MTTTGLDTLSRKLKVLEKAAASQDGDIVHLTMNPHDPQSIETAIQDYCSTLDKRVAGYGHIDIVRTIVGSLKESGRKAILDRAARARLKKGKQDDH